MRAMILAAGRGERMRPLTDTTPKPLLQVGGKPLIVWHIERLAAAGFRDIVINHAWLGWKIETALGQGQQFGVQLTYSAETVALETAGGIARVLPFFQEKPFLVVNGDVWCDWDPKDAKSIGETLIKGQTLAWLLLVDNPPHNPRGDFALCALRSVPGVRPDCGQVGLIHPPDASAPEQSCQPEPDTRHTLTFAGIGVYHPELFAQVPADRPAALAPLLRQAISGRRVIGSHHDSDWVDVGTPERLRELDRRLASTARAR